MSKEIKTLLKEAHELFKQNAYSDVVKKCKRILKKSSDNYAALVLLAAAMKEIEEFKSQTPVVLAKAIEIQPNNALAWQGLVAFYENDSDNNDCCNKLALAYCKILQINSTHTKFPCIVNKLSVLCSQLKDNTVLMQCIDSLNELRGTVDNEKMKLIEKTLASVLTDNSHNLNKYDDLLENILISIINNTDIAERQLYYKKYLKALYNKSKLSTLINEAINMHRQFPQDIFPLEYICRAYYEQSILEGNCSNIDIKQFFECLLKLNIESETAIIAKATYLERTDDFVPARGILKDMLISRPSSSYGWIILSKINMRLYCWDDAENAIRQAMKLEEYKTNEKLSCKIEIMLIETMSRSNGKYKWDTALQMCENHLEKRSSTQLELIHARLGVLLNDPYTYTKLNSLESQSEIKVQASILRALYLKQNKQLEEAANALDSALETSEAWFLLGVIYWEMSEYNYSLMAFLNGIKTDRYNWECFIYLGHYYREHGNDLERSRRCYQTALQINPSSEQAGIGLSTAYRLLKNQDANIQLLQKLTVQDTGPKWAWLQLGLQYLDQGDAEQAIKAFQRVIRTDPTDKHCWESLADAYFVRGAYTSALKSYHRALELCPKSLYPMIQLANIKLIIGQYNEAKKAFERILMDEPRNVPALKGLAETCLALAKENISKQFLGRANDNLQQAMDSLTTAVMKHKNLSCIWKLLGDTCYRAAIIPEKYSYLKIMSSLANSGNIDTILYTRRNLFLLCSRCYCNALSLSPHSALLWHDLASCYLMQLRLDPLVNHSSLARKCLAVGKYAVKLCSSSWLHWNLLGIICMSPYVRNYALAQHAYVMAIDKESNNAVVWSNLGTLYLYIGNVYKANEAYSQAQRSDPSYINSWIGQALIAEMMRRKEAVDLFRHSTQLGYHDEAAVGYAHWVLTEILNFSIKKDTLHTHIIERMHSVHVASDVMNWYIEHHPNDCYSRNAYGLLLERQKRNRSAAEQFAAATNVSDSDQKNLVRINLARILIKLGRYSEATELCRTVQGMNFNSQSHLALSLFKATQYEESYVAYEMAFHQFASTNTEKAYTLCAMAAIAYIFERLHDAKTLLFQCIQIQPPAITGFLGVASLGMLHGDLSLTTLVLTELKPYEDHPVYGHHVANLSAYFYLIQNNVKRAITTLSKAIFKYPSDIRYWIRLLRILLETDLQTFSKCAEKTMFLSKNIANAHITHVICASSFSYFKENLDIKGARSLQKLVFTYPGNIESWAVFIAAFLPSSADTKFQLDGQWLLKLTSGLERSDHKRDDITKWLLNINRKLQLSYI